MDRTETDYQKNLSYIRARDPSILALASSRSNFRKVRRNLEDQIDEGASSIAQEEQEQAQEEHLNVHLRIKKVDRLADCYEVSEDRLVCHIPEGSRYLRNNREGASVTKSFRFSKIFDPSATQSDIFNNVVKTKLLSFISGENATLLTYGVSGSGKTYTVIGTAEEPGIVPRTFEYVFRAISDIEQTTYVKPLPCGSFVVLDEAQMRKEEVARKSLFSMAGSIMDKAKHVSTYENMQRRLSCAPFPQLELSTDVTLGVWVSFAEIYNEQIYDLLVPPLQRGQQRRRLRLCNANSDSHIKDLASVNVTTALEAYLALQYGIHNLNYAATNLNAHSSRSHSIFTIRVVQVPNSGEDGVFSSTFNFCDLAGSERSKKTRNVGTRLVESNSINTSLLVLGKCIQAVRDGQRGATDKKPVVPFRESKLTALLQRALSGHEDISMVVNVNPTPDTFDETQHALLFSAIAIEVVKRDPPTPAAAAAKQQPRFLARYSRKQPSEDEEDGDVLDAAARRAHDKRTIAQLQDAVLRLQQQVEQQRVEFEEQDEANRDHIILGYQKILREERAYWEEQVAKTKEKTRRELRDHYELRMKRMRLEHLDELEKLKKGGSSPDDSVVVVVSSDTSDEEEEQEEEQQEEEEEAVPEVAVPEEGRNAKVEELALKIKEQEITIEQLKDKCRSTIKHNQELKALLQEAGTQYTDLEEECRQRDDEIAALKETTSQLEYELAVYKDELRAHLQDDDNQLLDEDEAGGEVTCTSPLTRL